MTKPSNHQFCQNQSPPIQKKNLQMKLGLVTNTTSQEVGIIYVIMQFRGVTQNVHNIVYVGLFQS